MLGGITKLQRAFLVDWMLGFTHDLRLYSETLFLAIGILDRFQS